MERKLVIVTGGSSGIGMEVCKIFAKNNYDVVICYNTNFLAANSLKSSLEKTYNCNISTIKCDISCEDEIKSMFKIVIETYKRIDCLVNNASIAIDTTVSDKNVTNFRKILDVNVIGTFLISRKVLDYMKEQGFGNVINVSSTNAIDTFYPESLDYDASKAGIISLTHNLAKYYAPIRVNCICPGWVDTPMNKNLDPEFRRIEEEKILLKRFAKPCEIASVIYDINNSSYINNSIIRVDGGVL